MAAENQKRHLLFGIAIVGVLLLMALLACTPGISFTEDLGRHLLLGRIISEQHVVPKTNALTYTHPDFPFINHHWLSEVCLYQLHRLVGLNGLIVGKMILMTAALALAMLAIPPRRGTGVYWLAGLLAAVLMGYRAHIRPELFTYLGVGFYSWAFERIRRGASGWRWAILAYAWFWANAHIYFVFGLFMAAAFVLERWMNRRGRPVDLLWLAALVLISVANPNGAAGLLYPVQIFRNYGMEITENASPLTYWQTVVDPMLIALPFLSLLALMAIVGALRQKTERIAGVLIALAALAASWRMARSTPLLALTSLPLIADFLDGRKHPEHATELLCHRAAGTVVLIIAVTLNLGLVQGVLNGWFVRIFPSPISPTPFGFDDEARYLALRELQGAGLKGPVFSDYNIGSLVEYNLYPEPGYVDNRPEAFPASFWRAEYLPALALGPTWDRIREARRINAIIVSLPGVKESYTQELMRRPDWVLVHLDSLIAAWVRNAPENRTLIEARRFGPAALETFERSISNRLARLDHEPFWRRQVGADRAVYECYALVCIGEAARAWPYIWQLHHRYPDYQIVHELMRVTAPPDKVDAVKDVMARHARWPVAAKQVLDWGRVLESESRFDEARTAYRRARLFFPLSPGLREALDRLEDREYPSRYLHAPAARN